MSVTSQVFVLAMLLLEAQARAQQEIDTTIGFDRLPNINDNTELPYVCNLIQEVLRWQPPVQIGGSMESVEQRTVIVNCYFPSGVPHACDKDDKDDVYSGYHIPKGTTLQVLYHFLFRSISRFGSVW
jgi:hypothetical protein